MPHRRCRCSAAVCLRLVRCRWLRSCWVALLRQVWPQCGPKCSYGHWIVTSSWPHTGVKVWNAHTGALAKELPLDSSTYALFSPDNKWLVTGTGDVCQFWQVGAWHVGLRVPARSQGDQSGPLAFSRDGRMLAIGRWGVVQLVDPSTGQEVATLEPPDPQGLTWLCFSHDGCRLIAATSTRIIQVWDLRRIREQLDQIGLDWDVPEYPPRQDEHYPAPRLAQVFLGNVLSEQIAKQRIERYRRAVEVDPSDAQARNNLAWTLLTGPESLRQTKRALELAEQAVELAPREPVYVNTLGVAYLSQWPISSGSRGTGAP